MTFVPSTENTTPKSEPPFEPFLLDPRYQDIFRGKATLEAIEQTVGRKTLAKILTYGIVGAIVACGLSYLGNDLIALLLFAIGFLATLVFYAIYLNWRQQRAERESHEGKIIRGQLTKIHGRPGSDDFYSVTVWYSFISPTGYNLTGKTARMRSDMLHRVSLIKVIFDPLPEPGTPVAVIYLDDKHYRML